MIRTAPIICSRVKNYFHYYLLYGAYILVHYLSSYDLSSGLSGATTVHNASTIQSGRVPGRLKTFQQMVGTGHDEDSPVTAEETVGVVSPWVVSRLETVMRVQEGDLGRFFASIPGFRISMPHRSLANWKAHHHDPYEDADAALLYLAAEWILRKVFSGRFHGVLLSVEMGRALTSNSTAWVTGLRAQKACPAYLSLASRRADKNQQFDITIRSQGSPFWVEARHVFWVSGRAARDGMFLPCATIRPLSGFKEPFFFLIRHPPCPGK
jgi:hypothetical protein